MSIYDPIMDALLAYLKAQTNYGDAIKATFQYMARGAIMTDQFPLAQAQGSQAYPAIRMPALLLYDGLGLGGGTITYLRPGGRAPPPVRVLARTVIIYARSPDPLTTTGNMPGGPYFLPKGGASMFYPLIEAVETALVTPDNPETGTLTLGGLVAYCRIEGRGMISPPDIDDNGQGMATIPLEIKVP